MPERIQLSRAKGWRMPENTVKVARPGKTATDGPERRAVMAEQPTNASPSPYRWIKLPMHCQLTGDTPDAVHARRRKRVWKDGVHCRVGPDGNLYVNPEAWNTWVEQGNSAPSPAHAE